MIRELLTVEQAITFAAFVGGVGGWALTRIYDWERGQERKARERRREEPARLPIYDWERDGI